MDKKIEETKQVVKKAVKDIVGILDGLVSSLKKMFK